eukprot:356560-Chlamydomonas_euryale.AAC.1
MQRRQLGISWRRVECRLEGAVDACSGVSSESAGGELKAGAGRTSALGYPLALAGVDGAVPSPPTHPWVPVDLYVSYDTPRIDRGIFSPSPTPVPRTRASALTPYACVSLASPSLVQGDALKRDNLELEAFQGLCHCAIGAPAAPGGYGTFRPAWATQGACHNATVPSQRQGFLPTHGLGAGRPRRSETGLQAWIAEETLQDLKGQVSSVWSL